MFWVSFTSIFLKLIHIYPNFLTSLQYVCMIYIHEEQEFETRTRPSVRVASLSKTSVCFKPNPPRGTGVPQLFGDDRLLEAKLHKGLHDGVSVRHIQADFRQLVVDALEALQEHTRTFKSSGNTFELGADGLKAGLTLFI